MRSAARLDPTSADKSFVLGEILRRGGNTTAALHAYERTLELDPDHPHARTRIRRIQQSD